MSDVLTRNRKWVTPALVAAVVAIFLACLFIGTHAASGEEEAFGGTDGAATTAAEEAGAEPWFKPLFEPAGEVESGLFAMQAAIGSGVMCFAIGWMAGNRRGAKHATTTTADTGAGPDPTNEAGNEQTPVD